MTSEPLIDRNSPAYRAASAVVADMHLGKAIDILASRLADIYGARRALTEAEQKSVAGIRNAMEAITQTRRLLAPLTMERGRR